MAGRADRIVDIIQQEGGRLHWKEVHKRLAKLEGIPEKELNASTVSATVRADNNTRQNRGQALRFNVHGARSHSVRDSSASRSDVSFSISALRSPSGNRPMS